MQKLWVGRDRVKFLILFLLGMAVVTLAGCGAGGAGTSAASGSTVTTVTNDAISLSTVPGTIKTDNSNSATLTATVTSQNAYLSGVTVHFSTTSGNLSASTATSANGLATVTLSSGASDFSNRTATVTATAGGFSATIPVLINGSTLTLSTPSSSSSTLQIGGSPGTIALSATAADASNVGRNGQTIHFSIDSASTGAATLSTNSLTTGTTGSTPNVTLTPTAAGIVQVDADWLDSTGAVSVRATKQITVTPAAGVPFAVTTPVTDPISLSISGTQSIVVSVPPTINNISVAGVRLSSSSGYFNNITSLSSITLAPSSNTVSASFTAPGNSGVVKIEVDALDTTSAILSTLINTFMVSAPSSSAATLNLQSSTGILVPTSGTNLSTATLTATVRDGVNNSVGNAVVQFKLLGTSGSGESISPVINYTGADGKSTAIFTAGSVPTTGAIYAQALIAGQTCTFDPLTPLVAETNPLCSEAKLVVSSSAVSVTVQPGTTISDTANGTQYVLPVSVLVVASGNVAVQGATVSLSAFPYMYRNGSITSSAAGCVAPTTSFVASEDANRNAILDPGEDTPYPPAETAAQIAAGAIPMNGFLSPPAAAGGSIPSSVITDKNGAATFNLQYPKSSAFFIIDQVTASVSVTGTESQSQFILELPASIPDGTSSPCVLSRTATY